MRQKIWNFKIMVFHQMGGVEQEEQKPSIPGFSIHPKLELGLFSNTVWLELTFKNHTCFLQKKIFQRFVIAPFAPFTFFQVDSIWENNWAIELWRLKGYISQKKAKKAVKRNLMSKGALRF